MNDRDHERFEAELRRLTPARPPAALMARLAAAWPAEESTEAFSARSRAAFINPQPSSPQLFWRPILRWLAPAAMATALAAVLLAWWPRATHEQQQAKAVASSPKPAPKADDIEIDRQLVGIFDTVAQLPSGQPVRFLCREWEDDVVVRDPSGGLEIERHTPRLEVVPLRFEIY